MGVDVSRRALQLAKYNMRSVQTGQQYVDKGNVRFIQADVLKDPFDRDGSVMSFRSALEYKGLPPSWDILISNPPYISPSAYWKTTTRSVRGFEPKLALVPPSKTKQSDTDQGDMFYPRLLEIARDVKAKIVLVEVADIDQARRVAQRAQDLDIFDGVEIWRDQPDASANKSRGKNGVTIVGEGNARSVLCWRGDGAVWLGKSTKALKAEDASPVVSHSSRRPIRKHLSKGFQSLSLQMQSMPHQTLSQ